MHYLSVVMISSSYSEFFSAEASFHINADFLDAEYLQLLILFLDATTQVQRTATPRKTFKNIHEVRTIGIQTDVHFGTNDLKDND